MKKLDTKKASHKTAERVLCFTLGAEEFAIPLLTVKEVLAVPQFTPIPQAPEHFAGMMNLRGTIISVIDLRKKLGVNATKKAEEAIIICDLQTVQIGVIVDSVSSVVTPKVEDLLPRPPFESKVGNQYIQGVYRRGEKLILMLDIGKALNASELAAIADMQRQAS